MRIPRKKRNNDVKLDARTCSIFESLYAGEIQSRDANRMLNVFNVRSLKAYKMWLGVNGLPDKPLKRGVAELDKGIELRFDRHVKADECYIALASAIIKAAIADIKKAAQTQNHREFKKLANWMLNNPYISTESGEYILRSYLPRKLKERKSNPILFYNGECKTVSEWAECLGVNPQTLFTRLKRGWSAEKALATPVKQNRKKGEQYANT